MKLRNKKTGEIIDFDSITDTCFGSKIQLQSTERYNKPICIYNSLAELNAEWEDYEEPKGSALDLMILTLLNFIENEPDEDKVDLEECKQILEKLKAWKRLKDKGAEFYGWRRNQTGTYKLYLCWEDRIPRSYEVKNDLNLLFGGEE